MLNLRNSKKAVSEALDLGKAVTSRIEENINAAEALLGKATEGMTWIKNTKFNRGARRAKSVLVRRHTNEALPKATSARGLVDTASNMVDRYHNSFKHLYGNMGTWAGATAGLATGGMDDNASFTRAAMFTAGGALAGRAVGSRYGVNLLKSVMLSPSKATFLRGKTSTLVNQLTGINRELAQMAGHRIL